LSLHRARDRACELLWQAHYVQGVLVIAVGKVWRSRKRAHEHKRSKHFLSPLKKDFWRFHAIRSFCGGTVMKITQCFVAWHPSPLYAGVDRQANWLGSATRAIRAIRAQQDRTIITTTGKHDWIGM
jgi:hypothetical protein